jgi:hypothetical protein
MEAAMIEVARSVWACAVLAAAFASTSTPAGAVSAELAKKCREMAVKAHPPQPAGTTPYAAAQREYFRECIAKGGKMEQGTNSQK